ncbi:hypothetical protein GALMADRAFT_472378 [Galerina marginata CBS 339.88]|uniref:Uncharacterized protein n=1 Tax=Galerina marginata (strain CBS 339.88) TaxID=685588 RepID=A0A067T8M9_GALM3|nr:hypothetical protein GALMADRAFT_472378 [Galerina marginata CBS 339.88]
MREVAVKDKVNSASLPSGYHPSTQGTVAVLGCCRFADGRCFWAGKLNARRVTEPFIVTYFQHTSMRGKKVAIKEKGESTSLPTA